MGRFASSVRDRLRVLQGPKGQKWDAEEEERLTAAVLRLTGRSRTDLIQSDIPWAAVAKEMKTRAPHQVTTRLTHLFPRISHPVPLHHITSHHITPHHTASHSITLHRTFFHLFITPPIAFLLTHLLCSVSKSGWPGWRGAWSAKHVASSQGGPRPTTPRSWSTFTASLQVRLIHIMHLQPAHHFCTVDLPSHYFCWHRSCCCSFFASTFWQLLLIPCRSTALLADGRNYATVKTLC